MAARHPQVPKEFERYLIQTERVVFATRLHWLSLVRPFALLIGWLIVIAFLDRGLQDDALVLRDAAIWIWVAILAYVAWRVFEWSREIFLATDRRLVLVEGLIVRKVNMMPMSKVTDMRYDRTIPGQLFGYGVFVLESAGQDQALTRVNFVPHPDMHYREIQQVLFAPGDASSAATTHDKHLPIFEPDELGWR
jgi:uncharacterized membrane protein YdbT with pleckstrin-like domain